MNRELLNDPTYRDEHSIVWGATQEDEPATPNATMTYMGHEFSLMDPSTWVFDINDIARALSNIARYGGFTFHPLTVAEHSLNVCIMLSKLGHSPEVQLLGLLHDSAEAYVGDVPRPWKNLVKIGDRSYLEVEKDLEKAIFTQEGLLETYQYHWDTIKMADTEVYYQERAMRPNPSSMQLSHNDLFNVFITTYRMLKLKIMSNDYDPTAEITN